MISRAFRDDAATALPSSAVLSARRPSPRLVEAELEAVAATVNIGGMAARLLTYNGAFPGPLLRLREGDHVRLVLTNRLDEPTNLHLHGLHVPPSVDDAMRVVAPGETANYEFDLSAGSSGTYWYHPHLHGSVARQLFAGLAGVMVVEGPLDDLPELRDAEEHVLVLKNLSLSDGRPAPYEPMDWMNGKEGDLLLINGMPVNGARQPVLAAERGTLRLRLINASTARYYHLALEEHPLYLIGTGPGFLERPVALDRLLLAPGERADVLVRLDHPGRVRLLDLPYDRGKHAMHVGRSQHDQHGPRAGHETHGGHAAHHAMGGHTAEHTGASDEGEASDGQPATPLLTIVPPADSEPLPLPSRLAVVEALDEAQAVVTRRIVMSETMDPVQFFINGRPFDPDRVDIRAQVGALELWEVENASEMDHPFHLHIYPFQVLSRNGVPEPFRAWRDVVNVRPREIVRLAVPLRDFAGKTIFHCHIAEHEDLGMMGVLEVHDPTRGRTLR